MGKKRHSKDAMYITATEWRTQYGGKREASSSSTSSRPLAFDSCCFTLAPFETPVLSPEDGCVFDMVAVFSYVKKHGKSPVSGKPLSTKDLVRINFFRNEEGKYHCPVTHKVFNNNSKIVAIKTTGNVYAAEAVQELNVKAKNWEDLMTSAPFTRKDIVKINDPEDPELCHRRDVSNFVHLKDLREDAKRAAESSAHSSNIRQNRATAEIFKEIQRVRAEKAEKDEKEAEKRAEKEAEDEAEGRARGDRVWQRALQRIEIGDIRKGSAQTTGAVASSFTSTSAGIATVNAQRPPTLEEVDEERWRRVRRLRKKAYVQLQTNKGNMSVEVHADMVPKCSENFLTLCERGYYDVCPVHRSIPNFMMQTGDPTGTGRGGESMWGSKFGDEFDPRLEHCERGVLSMANSGANTNGSQFFILYKAAPHLNNKHTVFGRVVGGMSTLDAIESVLVDDKDRPQEPLTVIRAVVIQSPFNEVDDDFEQELLKTIQERESGGRLAPQGESKPPSSGEQNSSPADSGGVGKYLPATGSVPMAAASAEESLGAHLYAIPPESKKKRKGGGGFGNFSSW